MRGKSNTPSFKEMEREGWHQNAPDYHDRAGQVTTQAIGRLLDAVAVQPGMQLLDLCCGPGYAAGAAVERGLAAMGVDIAPAWPLSTVVAGSGGFVTFDARTARPRLDAAQVESPLPNPSSRADLRAAYSV